MIGEEGRRREAGGREGGGGTPDATTISHISTERNDNQPTLLSCSLELCLACPAVAAAYIARAPRSVSSCCSAMTRMDRGGSRYQKCIPTQRKKGSWTSSSARPRPAGSCIGV